MPTYVEAKLRKLDKVQLKQICTQENITYNSNTCKRDLIVLIMNHQNGIQTRHCYLCKKIKPTDIFFYKDKYNNGCEPCSKGRIEKSKKSLKKDGRKCIFPGCGKNPCYGDPVERKRIYCTPHGKKTPGMEKLMGKMCEVCGKKNASFAKPGERPKYCLDCAEIKLPGKFADTVHKMCEDCLETRPNYNIPSNPTPIICGPCAKERTRKTGIEYCDVVNEKCSRCKVIIPVFNFPGETKGTHCEKCAEIEHPGKMVNVKDPLCVECKETRPNYNYPGEKAGKWCVTCAQFDKKLVDVEHKSCQECKNTRPGYNFHGFNTPVCCEGCAHPGMTDVVHKKCKCGSRVAYGYPQISPVVCYNHRLDGMIHSPCKKCVNVGCKHPARFGARTLPERCEKHQIKGKDIDCLQQTCEKCGRVDILNVDRHCVTFCGTDAMSKLRRKYVKFAEERTAMALEKRIGQYTAREYVPDSKCGKDRVDFTYECITQTHTVFIEVDERQHGGYCELGEYNRMKNLCMAHSGTGIIFIRYNPDNFRVKGVLQNVSEAERQATLVKWVKLFRENPPKYQYSVLFLYYDEFDENNVQIHEIDPYDTKVYSCNVCHTDFHLEDMYKAHPCEKNRRRSPRLVREKSQESPRETTESKSNKISPMNSPEKISPRVTRKPKAISKPITIAPEKPITITTKKVIVQKKPITITPEESQKPNSREISRSNSIESKTGQIHTYTSLELASKTMAELKDICRENKFVGFGTKRTKQPLIDFMLDQIQKQLNGEPGKIVHKAVSTKRSADGRTVLCSTDGCNQCATHGFDKCKDKCGGHGEPLGMTRCSNMCVKCGKVGARYNIPGLKPGYCQDCSTKDMDNLRDKPRRKN